MTSLIISVVSTHNGVEAMLRAPSVHDNANLVPGEEHSTLCPIQTEIISLELNSPSAPSILLLTRIQDCDVEETPDDFVLTRAFARYGQTNTFRRFAHCQGRTVVQKQ